MIKDRNIAWKTKRVFLAAADMLGISVDRTASLGAGAAVFQEFLAAAELSGLAMAADADEIYTFLPLPWDFDRDLPLRFRVWFVSSTTDADDVDWIVDYKALGKQAAISDARSTPDEQLVFPSHTCSTTDDSLEITDWVKSASETIITGTDFALLIALECDAIGGSANEMTLLGIEVEYTLGGANQAHRITTEDAPLSSTGPDSLD